MEPVVDRYPINRYAIRRSSHDIDYLDFPFSFATLKRVFELSGAFYSVQAMDDSDLGNRDRPIWNCCAVHSVYKAFSSSADEPLPSLLNSLALLNLCDL